MIGRLLHWVYCLDLPEALIVIVISTVLFCLIHTKYSHLVLWRMCVGAMLLALAGVILYTTLGNRSSTDRLAHCFVPFESYYEAMETGNMEIYRSNLMNIILFYPVGLLAISVLPQKWPGWCRCLLVVTVLSAVSGGIEFLQYRHSLGRFEVDDIIHNTTGALLGCLAALTLFFFLDRIRKHHWAKWIRT